MAVALIALTVALSGVGYAAVVLPRNSVGTPQLKRNAVVSKKVKDRSLKAIDFAKGQLPVGPTFGAASTNVDPDSITGPSPPIVSDLATFTATLPKAGRLYVFGGGAIDYTCSNCDHYLALYVDNQPVPGARLNFPTGSSVSVTHFPLDLFGITAKLPKGAHTVRLLRVRPNGAAVTTARNPRVGVILLGG